MEKRAQLFLLPYAGGNAFSFYKVSRFIDSRIEVISVEYAGRGTRESDSLISNYDLFLEDVVSFIKARRNRKLPFSILGYSLGCPISYDIVVNKMLQEDPKYIFFCAEGSLKKIGIEENVVHLNKKTFLSKMIELGGIDERFIENQDLLDSILPIIWNDFSVFTQFRCCNKPINIDASVIYSPKDKSCVFMDEWNEIVKGELTYSEIGESHFFLNKQFREFAQIINSKLEFLISGDMEK